MISAASAARTRAKMRRRSCDRLAWQGQDCAARGARSPIMAVRTRAGWEAGRPRGEASSELADGTGWGSRWSACMVGASVGEWGFWTPCVRENAGAAERRLRLVTRRCTRLCAALGFRCALFGASERVRDPIASAHVFNFQLRRKPAGKKRRSLMAGVAPGGATRQGISAAEQRAKTRPEIVCSARNGLGWSGSAGESSACPSRLKRACRDKTRAHRRTAACD